MSSNASADTRRIQIPAGTILMHQGAYGDRAWLVESGEMEALLERPEGMKRLGVIKAGSVVGEMALIDNGTRSATVRTLTSVSAVELTRETFQVMLRKSPPLARYLLESLIAAIRRNYGLPQPERLDGGAEIRSSASFQTLVERRMFRDGHVFFRQNDEGLAAYLIQSGQVSIRRVDGFEDKELALLGPGRIFGELALLTDHPRAASATATEATVCEIIRKESFLQALAAMPPILRTLTRIYIKQLSNPR
ncbi:cyclic nucleotide-binding domain-containing protein [Azospirillum sp.]|uniref:cyclic nucleotide-binding domain-containing protein n=1 Tax=Azospirillum sp. TaxID=34012 RepID=UPI00262C0212|nr:cyclic nucleotide-binding domain-containing protein [Azospirillum sp.]